MNDPSERLRWAIVHDHMSMVMRLVKRYPELLENPDPKNGWTSLHYAGYHGRYLICVFLIQSGHDREEISLDFKKNTPLHLAAKQNQEQTVHYLSQHLRRCLDWRNTDLDTPLMVATREGHQPCVTLLLDFGADVDMPGKDGNRPVHIAAAYGHLKAIRTLIDRKADTTSSNELGWTPLDYSYTYQVKEYMTTLVNERRKNTNSNIGTSYTPFSKPTQKSPLKNQKASKTFAGVTVSHPVQSSSGAQAGQTFQPPVLSSSSLSSVPSSPGGNNNYSSPKLPTANLTNAPSAPSPLHHSTILSMPVVAKPQNFHLQQYQFPPHPPANYPTSASTPISSPNVRSAPLAKPNQPPPLGDNQLQSPLPYPSSRVINPASPVPPGSSSSRSRSNSIQSSPSLPTLAGSPAPQPTAPSTPHQNSAQPANSPTQRLAGIANGSIPIFVPSQVSPLSNSSSSSTSPLSQRLSPQNPNRAAPSQPQATPKQLSVQPPELTIFGATLPRRSDTVERQAPIQLAPPPSIQPQLKSKHSAHSLRSSKPIQSQPLPPVPSIGTAISAPESPPPPPPAYSTTGVAPRQKNFSNNSASSSSTNIPHAYNNLHSSSNPDFPYQQHNFPILPPQYSAAAISASKHAVASSGPNGNTVLANVGGIKLPVPEHILFSSSNTSLASSGSNDSGKSVGSSSSGSSTSSGSLASRSHPTHSRRPANTSQNAKYHPHDEHRKIHEPGVAYPNANSFYKLNSSGHPSRQIVSATNLSHADSGPYPHHGSGPIPGQPMAQSKSQSQIVKQNPLTPQKFYGLGKLQGNKSMPSLDVTGDKGYPQRQDISMLRTLGNKPRPLQLQHGPPPIPPKRIPSSKTPPTSSPNIDNGQFPKPHSQPSLPPKSANRTLIPATGPDQQRSASNGDDGGGDKDVNVSSPNIVHPKPVKPVKPAHLHSFVRTPSPRNKTPPTASSVVVSSDDEGSTVPIARGELEHNHPRSVFTGSTSTIGPSNFTASGTTKLVHGGSNGNGRLTPFVTGDGELVHLNKSASSSSSSLATLMAANTSLPDGVEVSDRAGNGSVIANHHPADFLNHEKKPASGLSTVDTNESSYEREVGRNEDGQMRGSSSLYPLDSKASVSSLSSVSSASSTMSAASANSAHSIRSTGSGASIHSLHSISSSQSGVSGVSIQSVHSNQSTNSHSSVSMLQQARNHVKELREQRTGDRKKKEEDSFSSFNIKKPHNFLQQIASHYTSPSSYSFRDKDDPQGSVSSSYRLGIPSKHHRKSSGSSLSSVESVQILPLSPKTSISLSKFGSPKSPKRERKSFDR